MIFVPRPWPTIFASTLAPPTSGLPSLSCRRRRRGAPGRTSPASPTLPGSFSTRSRVARGDPVLLSARLEYRVHRVALLGVAATAKSRGGVPERRRRSDSGRGGSIRTEGALESVARRALERPAMRRRLRPPQAASGALAADGAGWLRPITPMPAGYLASRAARAPAVRAAPRARAAPRRALALRGAHRVLPAAPRRVRPDGRRGGPVRAHDERHPAARGDAEGRAPPAALRRAPGARSRRSPSGR